MTGNGTGPDGGAAWPPAVVAVAGVPGAGKTTLAEALAARTGWRTVSRDIVRYAMFQPCTFTDIEKHASFDAVLLAVDGNIRLGHGCIVEGMPFSRVGELERVAEIAHRAGVPSHAFLVDTPLAEAARRVGTDAGPEVGRDMSLDRVPSLVYDVAQRMRSFDETVVRLDGTLPPAELVAQALAVIAAGRAIGG